MDIGDVPFDEVQRVLEAAIAIRNRHAGLLARARDPAASDAERETLAIALRASGAQMRAVHEDLGLHVERLQTPEKE